MLYLIDCDIVYLYSHGSSSCCIGLIVALFICVLIGLPHVALYWLWQCLSVFLWFFVVLHWIDCDIVYLYSHGFSACCLGFIVTLFVFFLMVLPHVALDWLWYCFSCVLIWLRAKKGPAPPPLGNFADISYLKENFKPHLLRDVCTLCSGALVSDSLLHMLL